MSVKIINLDKIISELIHRPRISNYPLYTRVDEEFDIEKIFGNTDIKNKEQWIKKSKIAYNSPDNLRRLFITHKGVYGVLFRPVAGDVKKSLVIEKEFPIDLGVVVQSLINSENKGEKSEYSIKGNGVSVLYKPWVCSNIEELYFDWSMFISDDMKNFNGTNVFHRYTQGIISSTIKDEIIKILVENIILKGVNNLRDRFPRLRIIGYINNLEELYRFVPKNKEGNIIENLEKLWIDNPIIANAVKENKTLMSLYKYTDIKGLNTKFSIKDGVYLYDKEVLKPFAEMLEDKIKYNNSINDSGKDEINNSTVNKEKIEKELDVLYEKQGKAFTKIAIKVATDGMSREEIKELFNTFTEEGKKKYLPLLE